MWKIQLLGGLVVRSSERVVTRFRYHKAGSLLAYLTYFNHPHTPPHSREGLIEMLWPEVAPEIPGHKNLRNLLSALRPVLEPPGVPPGAVLSADRFSVRLNPTAITCDVHEFEADIHRSSTPKSSEEERLGWWLQAAQRYQGPLLPGYYEEWIGPESLRLSSRFVEVALQATPLLLQRGQSDLALPLVQRAVAADPLSEAATWALMQVLAAQQQPSQALRAYREFERKLKQEWEETPSEELRAYVRQLKKSASAFVAPAPPEEAFPRTPEKKFATNLPEPEETEQGGGNARLVGAAFTVSTNTRFFGREVEMGRLIRMLSTPRTRLITVTGPGGTGKTRLALEATARWMAQATGSGTVARYAVFVTLGEVTDPTRICAVVLRTLGVQIAADMEPLEQLSAALAAEPAILLILDNFEHLAEAGSEVVGQLLARAPQLKCLVTSRQKLLEGEQEFLLSPLPTSGGAQDPETLLRIASIALFVDRAQMVRPNFQVTAQNAATLAELCDQLEGIPLAIELAAARMQLLSAAHILEQIKANRLDFLTTRRRDALSRQRTLRSTLDWSFRLLPELAQRSLAQMSVFRGGWTLDAAQSVCRLSETDTLEMLSLLRDNSLLQVEDEEAGLRFTLLETVREYAAEQLEAMGEREELQRLHARYFLGLAEAEKPVFGGQEDPAILRIVHQEQGNFRAALAWTKAAGEVVLRARLGVALFPYWSLRMGYVAELRQWLWDLRDTIPDANPGTEAAMPPLLHAGLQYVLARSARILGDADEATALYDKSLQTFQQQDDTLSIAWVLLYSGIHRMEHDLAEAQQLFEESVRLMRQAGHELGIAMGLLSLTRAVRSGAITSREEYERAQALCAEARALCHRLGDLYVLAEILVEEGNLARIQGEFSRAEECLEENLALRRQLGDRSGVGKAFNSLGHLALDMGDLAQAHRYLEEALLVFQDSQWGSSAAAAEALLNLAEARFRSGDAGGAEALAKQSLMLYRKRSARSGYYPCLYFLAQVAAFEDRPHRAARLLGAAEAIGPASGARQTANTLKPLAQVKALVVSRLGEVRSAAEERIGRSLTEEEAIALALENTTRVA